MTKKFFILTVFILSCLCVRGSAMYDTTKINCYYNQVFQNFCATCVDQISFEVFTGIEVEKTDSTYRIYPPYKIFDEDTFTVIQDVYNNLVYIDLDSTIFADKEEVADYIAGCVGDSSVIDVSSKQDKIQWKSNYTDKGSNGEIKKVNIIGGSNVNVTDSLDWLNITIDSTTAGSGGCCGCDSILYFKNDSIASLNGINRYSHYLTAANNSYGMALGMVKIESEYYATSGVLAASCITNYPDLMNYYKSDSEAKTAGGLSVGKYYLLDSDNLYAMALGTIKRITE